MVRSEKLKMARGMHYVPHLLRYVLSLFWFGHVIDETHNVLLHNGCAPLYIGVYMVSIFANYVVALFSITIMANLFQITRADRSHHLVTQTLQQKRCNQNYIQRVNSESNVRF